MLDEEVESAEATPQYSEAEEPFFASDKPAGAAGRMLADLSAAVTASSMADFATPALSFALLAASIELIAAAAAAAAASSTAAI